MRDPVAGEAPVVHIVQRHSAWPPNLVVNEVEVCVLVSIESRKQLKRDALCVSRRAIRSLVLLCHERFMHLVHETHVKSQNTYKTKTTPC